MLFRSVVEEFFVPPVSCDLDLIAFEPSAIVDCGAHIGVFTLLAHQRFPGAALTAFEPNPLNAAWLRENLRVNGVSGVDVIEAAVSSSAGRSVFHFARNQSEAGRLAAGGERAGGDSTEVPVVDLTAFVRALPPGAVLLKIDIEGEEERVIPALLPSLPPICAMFFETHRGAEGWETVRKALAAHAFSVRLLRSRDVFHDGFAVRLVS